MDQVWVTGLIDIGLGLVFCFLGYSAARIVLALWGAVVGFVVGSLLQVAVAPSLADGPLASVPSWVFGLVLALLFAWLAFAFYRVAVLLSMASVGFGLGQLASTAFHLPDWLALTVAIAVAIGLVVLGWVLNLPKLLLVVLTALIGAGAVITGAQVLTGVQVPLTDVAHWQLSSPAKIAWSVAFAVLAIAGVLVQLRQKSGANLRDAYRK